MSDMLPRLFFQHFSNTCLILENHEQLAGFLVGFCSQVSPKEAYIHFAGVHPMFRGQGNGRRLYDEFFSLLINSEPNISTVCAVTSPINKCSVAFHRAMGFEVTPGPKHDSNFTYFSDYDGPEQDRVVFQKHLKASR